MTSIKISVVVAAYNVEPYLEKCIRSLLCQTEPSIEILIVNDGSTDSTPDLADYLASVDPRVRVIHQENRGLSGARNSGLAIAAGEFVCFVDGDDWVEPTMVETMALTCASSGCQVAIAGAVVDFHDENDNLLRTEQRTIQDYVMKSGEGIPADFVDENLINLVGYAWNKIYRRSWLMNLDAEFELGLRLVEDIEFNSRVLSEAKDVAFVSGAFVHYIQRPRLSLGTLRDSSFLPLNLRAIDLVDNLLLGWGVDLGTRAKRRSKASGLALWSALRAAARTSKPRYSLRQMLSQPGVNNLVIAARSAPISDWRSTWVSITLRNDCNRIALLPFVGLQIVRAVSVSKQSDRI